MFRPLSNDSAVTHSFTPSSFAPLFQLDCTRLVQNSTDVMMHWCSDALMQWCITRWLVSKYQMRLTHLQAGSPTRSSQVLLIKLPVSHQLYRLQFSCSGKPIGQCFRHDAFSFKPIKNWSPIALFDISISNIDCRYIDTFDKYRYRYWYRYGHFWNYRYRYRYR